MDTSAIESAMDTDMDPVDEVYLQKIYWSAIGAVVAVMTVANVYSRYLAWQRLNSKSATPAKPNTLLAVALASMTATVREISNTTIGRITVKGRSFFAPTVGKVFLVLANIAVLLTLCFYKLNPADYWSFEDIGYRTGRITACQLPLLFLLAGKRNLIGYLIGCSYERINWLHRWAARCMLLTTTLHMAYWFMDWARYDYISTRVATDVMTRQGLACWAILAWITFSSVAPIRGWRYEIFLIQHVISFAGLVGAIYIHITPTDVEFVWISVGVFFLDRFIRAGSYLYNNLFKVQDSDSSCKRRGVWGSGAELTALPGGHTRITIKNPPVSWKAGQHAFLSCHAIAPLQAHPFTIASIPSDGKMEFIVQSRTGGTRRLLRYAEKLLPETQSGRGSRKHVAIEGPYGHMRPLQQFDSVILYAGGTGATFTMPLFRDLIHSWKTQGKVVTRRIKFVWVIKSGKQLEWFRDQLNQVAEDVSTMRARGLDLQVKMTLYVTCDEMFTSQHDSSSENVSSEPISIGACASPTAESTISKDYKSPVISEIEKQSGIDATIKEHSNCCCRGDVEEDAADAPVCSCECCGIQIADTPSRISDVEKSSPGSTRSLDPSILVFSGRPIIREIMRTSLESAWGESAVVACGPLGLTHDVRMTTVSLSDERAVHKGTGAQGIWLHTEAFGY